MVRSGYFVVKFYNSGLGILAANINNLYERILFKKKDNAIKYLKKLDDKELSIYEVEVYADNKLLYENNKDILDNLDVSLLNVV